MAKTVLLNNVDHKHTKVKTDYGKDYGDDVMFCFSFPKEFRTAQAHYPIFFHKESETGRFLPVILLGLKQGENLFLQDRNWDRSYVPAMIARQPFSIGFQHQGPSGERRQSVIHIDLDNPRVNESEGEPLFLELGGNSPYLDHVAGLLETIHLGMQENQAFGELLSELDLIESFAVDIELDNGSRNQLLGFYTINEEKLEALAPAQLKLLQEKGFLNAVYMMLASQSQLAELVARKNRQLAGAR